MCQKHAYPKVFYKHKYRVTYIATSPSHIAVLTYAQERGDHIYQEELGGRVAGTDKNIFSLEASLEEPSLVSFTFCSVKCHCAGTSSGIGLEVVQYSLCRNVNGTLLRGWGVLYMLTFEMWCAPQRRALFRHLNFQKCSECAVFLTFSLPNVLRATTPCTFSASQLLKVVRRWCVLYMLTRNAATTACNLSDHMAPHRRFSERTFRQSLEKHSESRLPFRAPVSSVFWLFLFSALLSSTLLFSLTLPISAFHLSILSEVFLVNFLRLKIFSGQWHGILKVYCR